MLAGSDRVLFGAAYYHEYQPYDRLDVDLDLFVASFIGSPSMNFVRAEIVAERTSSWPAAPTSRSRCPQRTWRCVPI